MGVNSLPNTVTLLWSGRPCLRLWVSAIGGRSITKLGKWNLYTSLPKLSGCDLNPGPSAPESSTLITLLPSHPISAHWVYVYVYSLHSLVYNILWGWMSTLLFNDVAFHTSPNVSCSMLWFCLYVSMVLIMWSLYSTRLKDDGRESINYNVCEVLSLLLDGLVRYLAKCFVLYFIYLCLI